MKTTFRNFKIVRDGQVIDTTCDLKSLPLICKWKNVEPLNIIRVESLPYDLNDNGVWMSQIKTIYISVKSRGFKHATRDVKISKNLLQDIKKSVA